MGIGKQMWRSVWNQFATPQVTEEELRETLHKARQRLPVPVFWLLGKAQSGKTSLIRALTGNTRAEIGNGLRPCTKTATEYAFPNDEECLLRFLDTRGLGEVSYDASEDLKFFQDQAHLLIIVVKAMDHAQGAVLDAVRQIHQAHPQWPVLVVQTCLHEGYAPPTKPHDIPYPYGETPFPPQVSMDLARSLMKQRETFESLGIQARYVAVDFTLPEDGYDPVEYGLPELWTAIEELVPLGLRAMMAEAEEAHASLRDLHYKAALPHILSYAVAAGAAAAIPVPFVDMPVVLGIQAKMCHTIASIYHQELNGQRLGEILSGLGMGYLVGRLGSRELLKFIPVLGSTVSSLYSAATTYALGMTLCYYFSRIQNGGLPGKEEFQKIFAAQFDEGQAKLKEYLTKLRKPAG
ncbi:MAG: hypothetical protein JWM11_3092 [Planctomycetaceae bacterium]|nr:hypothetical protein [Planctomycetaceae bacterium]